MIRRRRTTWVSFVQNAAASKVTKSRGNEDMLTELIVDALNNTEAGHGQFAYFYDEASDRWRVNDGVDLDAVTDSLGNPLIRGRILLPDGDQTVEAEIVDLAALAAEANKWDNEFRAACGGLLRAAYHAGCALIAAKAQQHLCAVFAEDLRQQYLLVGELGNAVRDQ